MTSTPRRGCPDRGMVTLELAIGLMSIAVVLFASSALIGMLILQDRAESLATQSARYAARGDQEQLGRLRTRAPRGSEVEVVRRDGWATATVRVSRSWGRLGPIRVSATASQPLEPGQ